MLAVIGAGAALSEPGRAQPATSPIQIISVDTAGAPVAGENVAPKVSDDGSIVVFDSAATATPLPPGPPAQPTGVVTIRDRGASTTVSAPDVPSLHPGVSGDGCVIAYSVLPVPPNGTVELTALDRCGPAGGSLIGSAVVVDTVTASAALPAPALSADGSVIVWSTGRTIVRYVETATGYDESVITVPQTMFGTNAVATGGGLDISADGDIVVFVAGPGTAAFAPAPANVVSWSDQGGSGPITELVSIGSTGGPATGESTFPSMSGDGRIVVFQSNSPDLAVAQTTDPDPPFVAMFDRRGTGAILAADASRPTISTDGKAVVYDTSRDVHMQRWVDGANPFASVSDASLSIGIDGVTSAGPSVSGAVLSLDGNLVVFDSANGGALSTDGRFATGTHVWARATVDPPPTTSTPPTATTTPPNPTTTPGNGATTTAPPVTSAPEPTTPPTPTTEPTTTDSTGPRVPPTTAPTYRPPSGSGSGSTSGNGSRPSVGSGTTPFYSSVPIETVAFVPVAVEFSPTIVDAGRQSTVMSVSNPTASLVTVSSVTFQGDPDGAFTVSDNACEGASVPPGGSCDITVAYAPVTIGFADVAIVATLSNGSTVFGGVTGTGAPAPIVTVVPGVASSGQVVAIQGSGFPSGVTIELSWLGKEPAQLIEVDEEGSFTETVIVMPHTPRGPGTATVIGQTDLYATVVGEVLITDTSDRSSSALTQSAGSPFAS